MNPLFIGLGTALVKNLVGWAKNSLEDGEIQAYEVKKLIETIIVTGIVFITGFYGLSWIDVSNPEWISGIVTVLITPLWSTIKIKYEEWKLYKAAKANKK